MTVDWVHAWPTALAAFLASAVEFVEARTVALAVSAVRGLRGALAGTGAALIVLLTVVLLFGPLLALLRLRDVQLAVGGLLSASVLPPNPWVAVMLFGGLGTILLASVLRPSGPAR